MNDLDKLMSGDEETNNENQLASGKDKGVENNNKNINNGQNSEPL